MARRKRRKAKSKYPKTVQIDLDKDGRVDTIRIYNRKVGYKGNHPANVYLSREGQSPKRKRRKRRKEK